LQIQNVKDLTPECVFSVIPIQLGRANNCHITIILGGDHSSWLKPLALGRAVYNLLAQPAHVPTDGVRSQWQIVRGGRMVQDISDLSSLDGTFRMLNMEQTPFFSK